MSDSRGLSLGMGPKRRAAAVRAVQQELQTARLPNEYNAARLQRIAERLAAKPDKGLPQIMRDPSQLEGTYRFMSNEHIKPEELLAAHARETLRRAGDATRVVVAHDSSAMLFG